MMTHFFLRAANLSRVFMRKSDAGQKVWQLSSKPYQSKKPCARSSFFVLLSGEHLQKKMSSTKQYIQAGTSSRIDACFGGVVVEHESHKFQYYQDRNKRWPFTCSEKGCELFVLEKRSKFSRSLIFSLRLLLSFSQLNLLPRTRGVVVSAFDWSEERRGMLVRRALLCFLLLRFLSF